MKKSIYEVTRYDLENDFFVEVSPNQDPQGKEMYDFFLGKNNYSVKEFMFGLYANDCPPEEWKNIITNNVDQHIQTYRER